MQLLLLIVVLIVLVLCVFGLIELMRRRHLAKQKMQARAIATSTTEVVAQEPAGETEAELPAEEMANRRGGARWRLPVAVLLGTIAVLIAFFAFQTATARSDERFVVLIAPFDDGGDGQTGRNVAESLARLLERQGEMTVAVLEAAPGGAEAALDLARSERGDLLVYGEVLPGGMLDSPSLRPRLIYTPTGPYAPNGWDGYLGSFAMPRSYTLSDEPINGQAVLAPLLVALRDYSGGDVDVAYQTLERLLTDYPALNAPLPRALMGNLLWARGTPGRAAEQYRLALAEPSDEQALLANNLGAIQLDSGETLNALDSFALAIELLKGEDLGELRYNLGRLALADGRLGDATSDLEQARNLQPGSAPLLLALAEVYRETGNLDGAEAALDAAEEQARADQTRMPRVYQPITQQRSEAALREQRALLDLARLLEARGPLAWELDASDPLPPQRVGDLRDSLRQAAQISDQVVQRWRQRSAADAAAYPNTGQTAAGQAERALLTYNRQRYHQAALDTELARTRRRGGITSAFGRIFGPLFGNPAAASSNLDLIRDVDEAIPGDPQVLALLGRALRFDGQLDEADRTYDRVIALAGDRPEGHFGKGMVALDRGDPGAAVAFLNTAFERDRRYFPAPLQLARLAESQGDWAGAVAQRRILTELRPGEASSIALAQALRRSGAYAEAEATLVSIAGSSAAAAIELARVYNDAGLPDRAIENYRSALLLDPESSTAAFELGETLAAQGDLAGAEQALRDALRFDEANVDARLALADLYAGPLERPDEAREEYAVLLRQNVGDLDKLTRIGDTALASGDYNQAITAYERVIQSRPDDIVARHNLGEAYLATNRLDSAASAEQRVIDATAAAADPGLLRIRAEALARMGDVARLRGDLAQANSYYTQAQQIDGNLVAAQVGLGLSAVSQGNWGVARGYFETATRLAEGQSDPLAWFWLAEALLRSYDYAGAQSAYERALALQPTFPEAKLGQAHLREAQGDLAGALAVVEEALGQRPNYAEALLFEGKILQQLGRPDEAFVAYDNSIRANPRIAESYYRRAMINISNEENADAVRDLQRAVQLQPNFPEAHYWMGRAYYAQRRLQSALGAFRQAISLSPNYVEAIYYSGRVAEDLGLRPEAISAYQTVIQIDAGGEWGTLARTQLDQLG